MPVDSLLLTCWTSDHRRMQNVQISEKLHHNQGMPNVCSVEREFSLGLKVKNDKKKKKGKKKTETKNFR